MSEIFDIVDENGNPTGKTIERKEAHRIGARHRTAHIWIIRQIKGETEVLLQKRSMNKDSFPGRFDTSAAGHIQAGDEPLESAKRELFEELGIKAEDKDLKFAGTFNVDYEKEFHGNLFKDKEIAFVYVYTGDVEINKLVLQKDELDSVEWFNAKEVKEECAKHNQKFCVPIKGLEVALSFTEK